MRMIQVKTDKVHKISEMVEDMLLLGGKIMSCLEDMDGENYYGERSPYIGYKKQGGRYGMNDGDMRYDEPDYEMYGERRRRYR